MENVPKKKKIWNAKSMMSTRQSTQTQKKKKKKKQDKAQISNNYNLA